MELNSCNSFFETPEKKLKKLQNISNFQKSVKIWQKNSPNFLTLWVTIQCAAECRSLPDR